MLLTKLHIPSVGSSIVHRTSLFEKLNLWLSRKLILVSAPAGFGKSTLISDWIAQNSISSVWFTFDKGDKDSVEFFKYLITGIQTIKPDFGVSILLLFQSPNIPSNESIIQMIINEIIEIKTDLLIVLDDFHLIQTIEITNIVEYLLQYVPSTVHFAILTRSDPALPIARLRSQQQIVELRSLDLSFSVNDISQLFNKKLQISLSNDDIIALERKTEGWIAGLQLAALSLQNNKDISGFIQDLISDNRYIMDYLIEEVLRIQSDDIKDFLLQTSILEQISAPLCNAVLHRNDSQLIIEQLEKNNMFLIPLDNERNVYRYHHLFAQLLKQRLLLNPCYSIDNLHFKACEWFEQNKMYELAIDHAFEIKNYTKCVDLISKIVEDLWQNGQHSTIQRYCELLPEANIMQNIDLSFYYSWILITAGQIQIAEQFLKNAERLSQEIFSNKAASSIAIDSSRKMMGKIAVANAYSLSHEQHSNQIFEYCEKALEYLSTDDLFWYSWAWFSKGIAEYSNGDVLESSVSFNKAFDYSKKTGNIYLISTIAIRMSENDQLLGNYTSAFNKCSEVLRLINDKGVLQITKTEWTFSALYLILGSTHYMWAENDKAFEYLKTAYDLSKNGKDIFLKIYVLMIYIVAMIDLDSDELQEKIEEIDFLIANNSIPPFLHSYYVGWRLFIFIETNKLDEANNFIIDQNIKFKDEITHFNETAYSSYARLLVEQRKLDEAEILLNKLYDFAFIGQRKERVIDSRVSQAILQNLKGNKSEAIIYLIEAMELASKENLLVNFTFSYRYIKDLLEDIYTIQATSKTKISNQFIKNLKLVIEKKEKSKHTQIKYEISLRELETLKLVAQNLSNQEIADKLFISLNTVKTHLKNIFIKLEVDSRAKAVEKARKSFEL